MLLEQCGAKALASVAVGDIGIWIVGVVVGVGPPTMAANGGTSFKVGLSDPTLPAGEHLELDVYGSTVYDNNIRMGAPKLLHLSSKAWATERGCLSAGVKYEAWDRFLVPEAVKDTLGDWWMQNDVPSVNFTTRPLVTVQELEVNVYCDLKAKVVDIYGTEADGNGFSIGISDFTSHPTLDASILKKFGLHDTSPAYTVCLTFWDEHTAVPKTPGLLFATGLCIGDYVHFRNLRPTLEKGRMCLYRHSDFYDDSGKPKHPRILFSMLRDDDEYIAELDARESDILESE